jgi:hypothetical protein
MRAPLGGTSFVCLILITSWSCTDREPTGVDAPLLGGPAHRDADEINALVDGLPGWDAQPPPQEPARPLPPETLVVVDATGDRLDYRCSVTEQHLVRTFPSIISAGLHNVSMWPGAILQGESVRSGAIKPIRVARRPLRLVIDLALDTVTAVVAEPSASTVQQAVADLQRRADSRLGHLDVIPANVVFAVQEASTFEQAMASVGVHASYSAPYRASFADSISNGASHRTGAASLRQPMYTISFDRDVSPRPADFFADEVTIAELESLLRHEVIGDANLPVYIASVTYGKILTLLVTSDSVGSFEELKASMDASYEGFTGGGNLSDAHRRVLRNSHFNFVQFGGTQESVREALGGPDGPDWHKFFTPTPATQAVPISFEVRTLSSADEPAVLVGAVKFDEIGSCDPPIGYDVTLRWSSIRPTGGACHVPYWFYSRAGQGVLPSTLSFSEVHFLTAPITINRSAHFQVPASDTRELRVTSEIWTANPDPLLSVLLSWATPHSFRYPFNSVHVSEPYHFHQEVPFTACPARFEYVMTKSPTY